MNQLLAFFDRERGPYLLIAALDALAACALPISRIDVLSFAFSAGSSEHEVWAALTRSVQERYHLSPTLHLIEQDGVPAGEEILFTDEGADTVARCISSLVKRESHIHLLATGGSRTLAMFSIPVFTLLCDDDDHVWELVEQEGGGHTMLEVPIYKLGIANRGGRTEHFSVREKEQFTRCTQVVEALTPAVARVLRAFAAYFKKEGRVAKSERG